MKFHGGLRVVLFVSAAAIASAIGLAPPKEPSVSELARVLEEQGGFRVEAPSFHWAESEGPLGDSLFGRTLYFLAETTDESGLRAHDVFRTRVRVTPEGHPISIGSIYDLSNTQVGDEHALVLKGRRIAYATRAFGQEQLVTLLEEDPHAEGLSLLERLKSAVTNLQETGSASGLARTDIAFEIPAKDAGLRLEDDTLTIDLVRDAVSGHHERVQAIYDLERGELRGTTTGLRADRATHVEKLFVHFCVDTVRNISWIGPRPIAWLEERTFAARDMARRVRFQLGSGASAETLKEPTETISAIAPMLDTNGFEDSASFPPAPIESPWKTKEPGEGVWVAPKPTWVKKSEPDAPPMFVQTFVRPDADRPYSKVLLVAMDMQRLDLDMEAGVEDPKPLVGAPGSGRIPRDPKILKRVAATFNGGFKTEHGFYGMMVKRRVLLPPQPGAASIIVTDDGRVGMGSWSANLKGGMNIRGVADASVVSYRQNLDPLIDGTQLNPTKRTQWGFTLPGEGMQTERSGLCRTDNGTLMYVWGDDVNATTLAKAMKMASCTYGMHLDMNPHHTGFSFTDVDELKGRKYRAELLSTDMEIQPERYLETALKDFFYVLVRDPSPPPAEGVRFEVDPGKQPTPSSVPALFSGTFVEGGESVRLTTIDAARVRFRLRGGSRETPPKGVNHPPVELTSADQKRVLAIFGLGIGAGTSEKASGEKVSGEKEKGSRELKIDGAQFFPRSKNGDLGFLGIDDKGSLAIAGESDARFVDSAELPLLVDKGQIVPSSKTRSVQQTRSALGITESGRVVLAHGQVSATAVLGEALRRAGATRAVLLYRGGPGTGLSARAGTSNAPRARYDETVLVVLAEAMAPRTFRFEGEPAPAKK